MSERFVLVYLGCQKQTHHGRSAAASSRAHFFPQMSQPGEFDYLPADVLAAAERYRAMVHGWVTTDEIVPGLFLGPMESRKKIATLHIGLVVSVVTDLDRGDPEYVKEITVEEKAVVLDDDGDETLSLDMLLSTTSAIHAALSAGTRVLVHCMAGRSRSPSLVAAYLLAAGLAQTVDAALELIVKKRPCARPNDGFRRQLRDMEGRLFNTLCLG